MACVTQWAGARRTHIERLSETQGAVLRALAVEGVPMRGLAERMRTSEGVVRMTLHRALKRIAVTVRAASARVERQRGNAS